MADRVTKCLKVDPSLWKEAKLESVKREIELSELWEQAMRQFLKK